MNIILRVSEEIKQKLKVVFRELSLMLLNSSDIQEDQMEGESGVTQSITEELHSSDIQGDQKEGEGGVTRSTIDELYSWDIQEDQMEGGSGVT